MSMHPMTYATYLHKISKELGDDGRINEAVDVKVLAMEWEDAAKAQAQVHHKTWQAIAEKTFPDFIGKTPIGQRLLDLMRHNDVS